MSRELLFHEFLHGVIAIPFALLLWYKTKSIKLVIILFLVTYLVDLDHFFDYFVYFGPNFSLSKFLRGESFEATNRGFVPFHAWEWLIILGLLIRHNGWKSFYAALLFGLLPHYIWDFITVDSFVFYSIILRGLNKFYFFN